MTPLAAATSGAQNPTTTVIITAIGLVVVAIVSGALSAYATAYASRKRIKELELTQQHALREIYFTNARAYLESVYLPLHLLNAKLAAAFRCYRLREEGVSDAESLNDDFKAAVQQYIRELDVLLSRGASAFLTTALENSIEDLSSFLQASLEAQKPFRKNVYTIAAFGLVATGEVKTSARIATPELPFFLPFRISIEEDRLLQAPIDSSLFESAFVSRVTTINSLLKEVTLGGRTHP